MIKVQRTSPTYTAVKYNGNIEDLQAELDCFPLEVNLTLHTRIGDTEALYVMIEIKGEDKVIFVQKGEWMLFSEMGDRFVTTVADYGFAHGFKEV